MIVCHCNRICHRQIEVGCTIVTAADPDAVLTPMRVYDALGKRPRCGGCLTLAASLIGACCREVTEACTDCPFSALEPQSPDSKLTVAHFDRTMGAE